MIPVLQAIILGIVEGFTEFLPISSTGHLIVAEHLIGYRDTAATFTVVIQIGAILAVVWYYREDLLKRVFRLFQGSHRARRFWLNLVIATIPAAVLGLALEKTIEARLLSPLTVAISLIAGGIVLWLVEARAKNMPVAQPITEAVDDVRQTFDRDSHNRFGLHPRTTDPQELNLHEPDFNSITPIQALTIGLAQTLALIPGVSRSGASIVAGMLTGLNRVTATAFSFYLGLPILGLAGLYKLYKVRHDLSSVPGGSLALGVGTLVSFVVALVAVSWLLRYVSKHDFRGLAIYRVIAGVAILGLLAVGVLGSRVV
jgi:undecaprenyl-diphosphatase